MREVGVSKPRSTLVALRNTCAAVVAIAVVTALAFFAGAALNGGGSPATAAYEYQYGDTVTICHQTGSKKSPTQTVTVSKNALAGHLQHGDTIGPCA